MKKIDLLFGLLLGLLATFIGTVLYLKIFTTYQLEFAYGIMKTEGKLGKLITLGAVLNIALFFLLLQLKKEIMARGVVLALFILTAITLFV
jgi:hypothetical protein